MLLGAHASFAATGSDDVFDVTVTDRGRTVTGPGLPRRRRRAARLQHRGSLGRPERWFGAGSVDDTVTGCRLVDGRPLLAGGAAIWHLPDGEFRYAEIDAVD